METSYPIQSKQDRESGSRVRIASIVVFATPIAIGALGGFVLTAREVAINAVSAAGIAVMICSVMIVPLHVWKGKVASSRWAQVVMAVVVLGYSIAGWCLLFEL